MTPEAKSKYLSRLFPNIAIDIQRNEITINTLTRHFYDGKWWDVKHVQVVSRNSNKLMIVKCLHKAYMELFITSLLALKVNPVGFIRDDSYTKKYRSEDVPACRKSPIQTSIDTFDLYKDRFRSKDFRGFDLEELIKTTEAEMASTVENLSSISNKDKNNNV